MQLDRPQADGCSLRKHLQAAAAASRGQQVDPLLLAEVPPAGAELWRWYCTLNARRPPSMGGVVCWPPSELLALQQLHGVQLTAWEVDTLLLMDQAAVTAYHDKDAPAS